MNSFLLEKNSDIYLYGDNYIAHRMYHTLSQMGYCIRGILDRTYKESIYKSGIWYGSQLPVEIDRQKVVVIICLQNALGHETVVKDLLELDIHNIVYLPMGFHRPMYEADQLRNAYRLIFEGNMEANYHIPVTLRRDDLPDALIILEDEVGISFFCPVDKLYTSSTKKNDAMSSWEKKQNDRLSPYFEIPILNFKPYFELFSYFLGSSEYPQEYLSIQRESAQQKKVLLEDRKKLFDVYEKNFKYNFNFFTFSPARVVWNKRGYFNIVDGAHRSVYLIAKGLDLLPVRTRWEDYYCYQKSLRVENYDEKGRMESSV